MSFRSTRRDTGEPASALDLGDLLVSGEHMSVSSAGRQPDQGMMIYLAMDDLISGLLQVADGERRDYEFIGVDSSFRLDLARTGQGQIVIGHCGNVVLQDQVEDVLNALWEGVVSFLSDQRNQPVEDVEYTEDLAVAVELLELRLRRAG